MVGRGLGRWIGIPRAYETVACFKKGERERERERKRKQINIQVSLRT